MSKKTCVTKEFKECRIIGQRYECGSSFVFEVHVVKPEKNQEALALYMMLEHSPDKMTSMLTEFMQEGLIPYGMIIFVNQGYLYPSLAYGAKRGMRAEELDQYGPEFTNFLIQELIPEACRISQENVSSLPDLHFISGGSSGGMAAWNAVWFCNDYFRRAFLSSPTFSAIRGGEEAMVIARKTEAKPIKLYITCGKEEPDYFFGSSLLAAQNAASALEFAGYDFRFEQFNEGGHCCHREDIVLWRRMMGFLWANWKTIPVVPLTKQIRIRKLVADDSQWQKYDGEFPEKQAIRFNCGNYSFTDDKIFFEKNGTKTMVADKFRKITALGLSSDKCCLYIADAWSRFLFAMSVMPDGSLKNLRKLAPLHLKYDFRKPGASDIAVLADDRILAGTELGIQGVVSFGLTDLILPLPGDLPADRVTVRGNILYAASGNIVFYRSLKVSAADCDAPPMPPTCPEYGDGFFYIRSHLFFS